MSINETLTGLFSLSGRLSRLQFFLYGLLALVLELSLMTGIGFVVPKSLPSSMGIMITISMIGLAAWMLAALTCKRSSDIGWPPALGFVLLVIAAGFWFLQPIILSDRSLDMYTAGSIATILGGAPECVVVLMLVLPSAKRLSQ